MKFTPVIVAIAMAGSAVASNLPHRGRHARFHEKNAGGLVAPDPTMIADLHKRDPTLAKRCCEMVYVSNWSGFINDWGPCAGQCGSSSVAAATPAPAAPAASSPAAAPAVATSAAPAPAPAPAASSAPAEQPHNQAPAPAASSSAASTPAASSSASGSSSSSCKKGLSYNLASLITSAWTKGGICWAYNWADSSGGLTNVLQFVPMLHDLGSVSGFASSAASAGSTAPLLSFNEPDMPPSDGGSNIDPSTAAQQHKSVMAPLQKDGHSIGCPAVSSSANANQGLDWLSQFATACGSDCPVDFCPVHWYGWDASAAAQATAFQSYVGSAIAACQKHWGKNIWVTEFAAIDQTGSNANSTLNAEFLNIVAPWMESNGGVERYSPFMVADGGALGGSSPSEAGNALIAAL